MVLSPKQWILFTSLFGVAYSYEINNKTIPKDFWFGVATAAFQIEGGWNADGKGENIWDHIIHRNPSFVKNNDSADIACDSYNKYKEDVAMMKDLGLSHYRFSLSWSRILPEGFANKINQPGVTYYRNLIKELRANNIEPLVTLYHWDLPQPLQDLGGWPNDESINWFADYAKICFELFGDSVKYWLTFNEPKQTCAYGYGQPTLAPAVSSPGIGDYLCAHNIIRAHAKAWHIYDDQFRSKQKGLVGFVIDSSWYEPASNSNEDQQAAEDKLQSVFGWYGHPLIYGDYPQTMKTKVARRSKFQGFPRSRLPEFTKEEMAFTKGTLDYLGLNHYYSQYIGATKDPNMNARGYDVDMEIVGHAIDNTRKQPWGIKKLLLWIKEKYNNPHIIITENGHWDNDGRLDDDIRVDYLKEYLSNVMDAKEEGVNVTAYTFWSLMDNFEWIYGYTERYGLYHVDFNSSNRTRTPKKSAGYYKKIIETRCLLETCENI